MDFDSYLTTFGVFMPSLVPLLLLIFAVPAWAQVGENQANLQGKNAKKITTTFNITTTTDSQRDVEEKALSTDIWVFVAYRLSSEYTTRVWLNATKDMSKSYETTINDTRLTLIKNPISISKKLMMIPSASLILPTSENSKRNQDMIAGIELNPAFAYTVNNKISLSYLPRIQKNFHEYTTSRTGAVNTEYRLIQFMGASYAFDDKFSFNPLVIYVDTWSYRGTQRTPSYLTILDFGYRYSGNLSFSVGASTGGSILDRENGPDQTLELYDANVANYYINFIYRI